jgi:ATP phosphoribosyltransferase
METPTSALIGATMREIFACSVSSCAKAPWKANKKALQDPWKKEKIENMSILLKGALAAEGMVGLKMNLEEKNLAAIQAVLPALKKPTISKLSIDGWIAIEVILEEKTVKKIIPALKRAGAEGIIEYPLNKLIY